MATKVDTGQSLSVAKSLGYTGSSNQEFDSWFSNLDELSQEAVKTGNSALVSYIQAINSTSDPYRRQQLENALNSYRSQVFEPNFLQRIGEDLFGDTSSRTNFENQVNDKFIQAISGIQEGEHKEDYTDPASEVARRRAAGINDDLSGASQLGSGEPGSIDEPNLTPGIVNDQVSFIPDVLQGALNVFSSTMSFISGLKNFQLQNLSIASNELNNLSSADSWLTSMLKHTIRYDFNFDDSKTPDTRLSDFNNALVSALESISSSSEFSHLSPYTRKAVKSIIANYDSDNIASKALYEQMKNDFLKARKSNVEIESSPNFSDFVSEWISNCQPYMQSLYDAEIKEFEARQKQPELVESQIYVNTKSGDLHKKQSDLIDWRKSKIETISTLFDNIKSAIPKDKQWKGIASWFTDMGKVIAVTKILGE